MLSSFHENYTAATEWDAKVKPCLYQRNCFD